MRKKYIKFAIPDQTNILTPNLSGISGEYFVAAELFRLGYIAAITPKSAKGIDILVSNQNGSRTVAIQVKTTKENKKIWLLTNKSEENYSKNLFYVFVDLKDSKSLPEFHIVPSKAVAKQIRDFHLKYLNTLDKNGRKHKDSTMRKFFDEKGFYKDKWDLLGLRKVTVSKMKISDLFNGSDQE